MYLWIKPHVFFIIEVQNMNKKGLAILMRTRMRANRDFDKLAVSTISTPLLAISQGDPSSRRVMKYVPKEGNKNQDTLGNTERDFDVVYQSMQSAILTNKVEVLDPVLTDFSEGYFKLSPQNRWRLILALAKEHDLNRMRVQELIKQYLGLELPTGDSFHSTGQLEDESPHSAYYRIERNLRHALKPVYEVLFERLNMHTGGLRFLSILRADILSILEEENIASLRALDFNLKEKLTTWLSPAALELHRITWDDSASFLEKIVAYEAVHPISNLIDLKRRLGVGRRCFGYLHPSIPGEPLVFIEVALLKDVARAIQEVLWDDPPIPESEATCATFYSISATQPGLAGIKLGKFLIKRVINLVQRDMPHVTKFATISPIPGYMQWLLSKLSSQSNLSELEDVTHSTGNYSASTFWENILTKDEEKALMESSGKFVAGKTGMEVMLKLLTSTNFGWTSSNELLSVLEPPLMRLCARYLLLEKKRGKALDPVANFHLQNGAMVDRINWMANRSEKGLLESGSIMVNYVYRLEYIEEYGHSYSSTGKIQASQEMLQYVEPLKEHEETNQEKLR